MVYPDQIEKQLGFDKIKRKLIEYCQTSFGKAIANRITWINQVEILTINFKCLDEIIVARSSGAPPIADYSGLESAFPDLKIEGKIIGLADLFLLLRLLETSQDWNRFLSSGADEYPNLYRLGKDLVVPTSLLSKLKATFDDEGEVSDDASPDLKRIRKKIREQEASTRRALQREYKQLADRGWIAEGSSISIRNGRSVIPLKAENKRKVAGYMQGESASGSIVFVEPEAVVELTNEVVGLIQEEKREILRIQTVISKVAHDENETIVGLANWIGNIDYLIAKSSLVKQGRYSIPQMGEQTRLIDCFHPGLIEKGRIDGKEVIPLSLSLTEQKRIIAISGPNAGGKSVALKTVGLVQLMFQYGLPIPGSDQSCLKVFEALLLDIGDNQSLENDLSTYSSHLKMMNNALKMANTNFLFLFDEFGSGTAPRIGGAIGQAVLESMESKGAYGILTTHYDNIKELADKSPGISNGAMRFDVDNLNPLYQFDYGKPGSSFALEMAKKSGLPKSILSRATELAGEDTVELEVLLTRIQNQKKNLDSRETEIEKLRDRLQTETEKYIKLKQELDSKKKQIIGNASIEAERLLSNANREIEKTIRHIKTSKAHKEETKKVRKKFETKKSQLAKINSDSISKPTLATISINIGDRVKVKGYDTTGIVKSIDRKDVEITSGSITLKTKMELLTKIEDSEIVKKHQERVTRSGIDLTSRKSNFSREIDLRGMRGEIALSILDKHIDDALLLGNNDLRILHGKGDGILRKLVRQVLMQHPSVDKFDDEHADRGGAGITLVKLK